MFKVASSLIDEVVISIEGTEFVKKSFLEMKEHVKELNKSVESSSTKSCTSGTSQENRYLDPFEAKTKGSGKRIMSWTDKSKGKARHCSICRSTKHTRATCKSDKSNVVVADINSASAEEGHLMLI
ncbi:hypothetical protein M5689_012949 [Euphorbia peplus]|nr:hypothetical protein M5689_012949 [Euphorbia peplus]